MENQEVYGSEEKKPNHTKEILIALIGIFTVGAIGSFIASCTNCTDLQWKIKLGAIFGSCAAIVICSIAFLIVRFVERKE